MNNKKPIDKEADSLIFEGKTDLFKADAGKDASTYQRLALAITEGDHEAWSELYLLLYDPLAAFIHRIIRSKEDAFDLAQDVFTTLWQNKASINPEKNIKGYIYAISKTLAFRYLRKQIDAKSDASLEERPAPVMGNVSPEDVLIVEEINLLVELALYRMPEQRRRVFIMSRNEGLSYDEIAVRMNISKRTVTTHIYNVTKDLKKILYMATTLFWADMIH